MPLSRCRSPSPGRGWPLLLAGILAWSIGIELVQPLVGRSRDIDDFLANSLGALLAVLVALPLRPILAHIGRTSVAIPK